MDLVRALLAAALMGMAGAPAALAQTAAPTTTPAAPCAACVVVAYGGRDWQIDPALGPVQGVVTKRIVDVDGVSLEGIVFLHDAGGWRAAGTFSGGELPPALRDANVSAELTLDVAGS